MDFQALAAAAKALGALYVSCLDVPEETVLALVAVGGYRIKSVYEPDEKNATSTVIDGASCDIDGVFISVQTARREATTEEIEKKKRDDAETADLFVRVAERESEVA